MERLLVIGANGLLGSKIVATAKGRYKIYGTYRNTVMNEDDSYHLDVVDRDEVFKLVAKIRPDLIVDTHAIQNVDYCESHQEETWRINVEGTRNVAEAAKASGSKYAFISSDYVFDGSRDEYREGDARTPLNYYGKTKSEAESVIENLDFGSIVSRCSVIYGSGGAGKLNFVLWLIKTLREGQQARIVTDQENNPTYADTIADALLKLHENGESGTFHICGAECLSRFDFSNRIAKTFELDQNLIIPIKTSDLNQVAKRPKRINMNTEKIVKTTGVKMLSATEGLQRLREEMEQ